MNRIFFKSSFIVIIFCLVFAQSLPAQSKETISASYKYTLGDSDTKSDAKKIAFIEAKRLCIEKAGSYIESNTEVLDFKLSKDEIRTYTGGILKTEIVSEEFKAVGETLTLFMEVKAEVDLNEVRDSLKRVREDRKFAATVKKQENQLQALEDKIRKLQQQLSNNDFDKTAKIRQERKEVFGKIDEIEEIRHKIHSKAKEVVENIDVGMTDSDVLKIAGQPRSKDSCASMIYYNYGKAWIIFNSRVVACIVPSEIYSKCAGCDSYRYRGKKLK
jgi:hypothetical protein